MNLRHRIEIGRYIEGIDEATGDPISRQWQQVCKIWAAIEALTGRIYFEARQTVEQSDHRIIIRWREDIESGMVIRYNGREYVIQAVMDKDGKRRWLEILAREARPA